jgi:hypothetical protein
VQSRVDPSLVFSDEEEDVQPTITNNADSIMAKMEVFII